MDGEKIEYHKNGKIKKKEIYKNGELQKDGLSKFWNILVILAFGIPFLTLPFSFFKIYKQFPKVKLLDEYQKEKILEILKLEKKNFQFQQKCIQYFGCQCHILLDI